MTHTESHMDKINLKGLSLFELEKLVEGWGEPKFRAKQLMSWLYHQRETNFQMMTNLPKSFRRKLSDAACVSDIRVCARAESDVDSAVKYLFELTDGSRIESVLMPDRSRITVCVSSQVGCAMACDFCATGKMGFFRNLSSAEIVDQVIAIQRELDGDKDVTHVVFMGMGEPLANYDQTVNAVRLMTRVEGLGIPERRITVSTVGLAPRMRQFAREGLKCQLALSLNATTDKVRTRLMPINTRYQIADVLDAAREWTLASGNPVTLEYVLIRDVNDGVEDAHRICKLMSRLPCKLNIIPFNEIEDSEFRRPEANRIEQFRRIVSKKCYIAPIRFSKGKDITAACGQLRTVYGNQGITLRNASKFVNTQTATFNPAGV